MSKKKRLTKLQKRMRLKGSNGGNATVKRHGKKYMRKLVTDYWKKRKARERRSNLQTVNA